MLNLEITKELVNQPLLIMFRGKNFSNEDEREVDRQCQLFYIEMEFRAKDSAHKCSEDYPSPTFKKQPIELSRKNGEGKET